MERHLFMDFAGTRPENLDHATASQAIGFVYANLLDVSRIQIIYPVVVAYVFWGKLAAWKILLWCLASVFIYVARIGLTLQYRKKADSIDNPWHWGHRFTLTSIFSGFLWGFAAWLFYIPDAQTELVLLYVLIIGTAAGAVMISSYWMPGYLCYALPAVSLVALSLIINGDRNEAILGAMISLTLIMLVTVAFKSRDQGYAGIRLRFENLDLIEKLNAEKNRAEDANRAKTRFLASANHDLRQPVHALSLLSYSLNDELHSSRGKELYTQLEQTVTNLNNLLESLLDLSQLEADVIKIDKRVVKLSRLSAQLQSEFRTQCRQKNLDFRVLDNDGLIRTDQTLLLRLLRNLLSNAVRYTENGGVLLAFREQGKRVSIEIWDTGVGIDPEHQQDIFREFYQLGNKLRQVDQGLGLGLSICQKIAKLLELELVMYSRPGRGTVFKIELPLLVEDPLKAERVPDPVSVQPLDHDFNGVNALVVDDDLVCLSALAQVLAKFGMRTTLAQAPERAIELAETTEQFDLVLLDFRLSEEIDAIQLIRKLRRKSSCADTPALIITGDTAPLVLAQIRQSGIPYINKPVQVPQLAKQIEQLLSVTV